MSTGAFPTVANRAKQKLGPVETTALERLILMRHGEAERPAPGLRDVDRALDADGRTESRAVAAALAQAGIIPDLALVSGARRTLETWRAAAESFPAAVMEEDASLYAATVTRLGAAVAAASSRAETLMLVGHNPAIHQYAVHLCRQGGGDKASVSRLLDRFATGTAAVFSVGEGPPELERLFLAKDYRTRAGP